MKPATKVGLAFLGGFACARFLHRKAEVIKWSAGDSLDDLVSAHSENLRLHYSHYDEKFQRLRRSDPEAAAGEATLFSLLKTYFRASPEPADEPGTGGVDFICHRNGDEFVVEVTSLNPDTVHARSGISPTVDESSGGAFQMVTTSLFNKACGKADQLSGYSCARVLAITSTHFASSFLLDTQGAEWLLTSEPRIQIPAGGPGRPVTMTTDLQNSIFFGPNAERHIVARRKSISAILLIGIFADQSNVVGILHPEPAQPLNIGHFREVPFVRLSSWPIAGCVIKTEWVVDSPQAKTFWHSMVKGGWPGLSF